MDLVHNDWINKLTSWQDALETELNTLKNDNAQLEARLSAAEAKLASLQAASTGSPNFATMTKEQKQEQLDAALRAGAQYLKALTASYYGPEGNRLATQFLHDRHSYNAEKGAHAVISADGSIEAFSPCGPSWLFNSYAIEEFLQWMIRREP